MDTLRMVARFKWQCDAGTVQHENVDGVGWSYVVRRGAPGFCEIFETLDAAMVALGCDRRELRPSEAAELSRD